MKKRPIFFGLVLVLGTALIFATAVAQSPHTDSAVQWPTINELLRSKSSQKALQEAGLASEQVKALRAALESADRKTPWLGSGSLGITKVQLTADGQSALFVSVTGTPPCGAHDCPIWIVSLVGNHADVLLKDWGWGLVLMGSTHNGHFDVVTASGSRDPELLYWAFGANGYRVLKCSSAIEVGTGDEPRWQVSVHPCPSSSS